MRDRRPFLLILIALPALGAILLYWPALSLPLLYDDLLHIRIAKGLDLLRVWLPTDAFGFYRPLTFLPLLVVKGLLRRYPAGLLHGLNIVQHALNGSLLTWLSWRLWRRPDLALSAGLLLVFFPFSYQAVAVYGHNVHPATTGLLLLALHAYLSASHSETPRRWWILTGVLFGLALLSHESAILFGPLAALVSWSAGALQVNSADREDWLRSVRRLLRPALLFTMLGGLYAVGYQLLPISRAPQAAGTGAAVWPKMLYLFQALASPLIWPVHRLLPGWPTASIVLGALLVTLAFSAWLVRGRQLGRPLLLGWGWWALASLLIAIPLSSTYLLHGPRLLYLGSVGQALLWSTLLVRLRRTPRLGVAIWLLALGFIVLVDWHFVRGRLAAYDRLTEPVRVIQDVMADRPSEEGVVVINFPQWLAPAENSYPVGVEFVAMLGDYLFIEELMAENLGVDRPVQARRVDDLLADTAYGYAIHRQGADGPLDATWTPAGSQVFVTSYGEEALETRHTGGFVPFRASSDAVGLATVGSFTLLEARTTGCSGPLQLETLWQPAAGQPVSTGTSLFAQLLDGEGRLIAQHDGPPLGLRSDLIRLPDGWGARDLRVLDSGGTAPDRLLLGAYDFTTGERFPALDGRGQSIPDDALSIPLPDCS